MAQQDWSTVGKPVRKKDAMALLLGKPAYLDDLTPKDCLVVKVLRSPHAHALIEEIDTENAEQIPGVAAIFTYRDVPQKRFTMAGQTYPEPSPYDRLILDRRVRFVGDAVAIVAGENEAAVDRALKRIRVRYQVLEPVLDFHTAKDNLILVHPEESWRSLCPVGADNRRNLCASETCQDGDVDRILAGCDQVVEGVYHTKACQQAMPVPQVAVFDTGFHQTMPPKAYLYGLPYEAYEKHKVRRYGFHGTSHLFVSQRAAELRGTEKGRMITCHLGNGSSLCENLSSGYRYRCDRNHGKYRSG